MKTEIPPILKGERERKVRSLTKTLSWRVISIILTFAVAWAITKNLTLAINVAWIREVIVLLLFYNHERIWNRIRWGKFRIEKIGLRPKEPTSKN